MQINDPDVAALLDKIGNHYQEHIANRLLGPFLTAVPLEKRYWDCVVRLGEKREYRLSQGFLLEELYEWIIAFGKFVAHARRDILPNLKGWANARSANLPSQERVLRDMMINNFGANLAILARFVEDLYALTREIDAAQNDKKGPVYLRFPELETLKNDLA